ncbi:MAG TPA: SDR family oxidoreductase [Vicinamibacteria bacterium]
MTGGTRGIGRAVSLAIAASGAAVYAVFARNQACAAALAEHAAQQGLDIRCLRADLTDDEQFRRCVETIRSATDRIDVIVHSAASGVHREAAQLTVRHLAWTFAINVFAFHRLLVELLPLMGPGGRIIGVTSHGGTRAVRLYAAVGSSKGALESLFRHYAQELAPRGIAVNLVCPGLVLTEALDAFPDREDRVQAALSKTPTGRLTTVDDVAEAVLFLCGERASQIVGQTLVIDGGRSLS